MKKSKGQGPLYPRKVMCRFTMEEYQQLKTESLNLGLNMSDYFRRLIFNKRAHLLVDAEKLVEWLDQIATESTSSNRALSRFIENAHRELTDRYQFNELAKLIYNCITSQTEIERCVKRLIRLMSNPEKI